MGCFVVAEFLLTSASRSPSAIAEPLVNILYYTLFPSNMLFQDKKIAKTCVSVEKHHRHIIQVKQDDQPFLVALKSRFGFEVKVCVVLDTKLRVS